MSFEDIPWEKVAIGLVIVVLFYMWYKSRETLTPMPGIMSKIYGVMPAQIKHYSSPPTAIDVRTKQNRWDVNYSSPI
jgi:hypothetical protein